MYLFCTQLKYASIRQLKPALFTCILSVFILFNFVNFKSAPKAYAWGCLENFSPYFADLRWERNCVEMKQLFKFLCSRNIFLSNFYFHTFNEFLKFENLKYQISSCTAPICFKKASSPHRSQNIGKKEMLKKTHFFYSWKLNAAVF